MEQWESDGDSSHSVEEEIVFKVRTTDSDLVTITGQASMRCSEVKAMLKESSRKQDHTVKLIYGGRMLGDNVTLGECGICSGHTLHGVFQPPAPEPVPTIATPPPQHHNHRSPLDHPGPHESSAHRYPSRSGTARYPDLRAYIQDDPSTLAMDEAFILNREYGNAEVLAGIVVGFLLGFLAAFCLIDSNVSRLMKMGILIGLFTHFSLTWMRLAMGQSMHNYQNDPYNDIYNGRSL